MSSNKPILFFVEMWQIADLYERLKKIRKDKSTVLYQFSKTTDKFLLILEKALMNRIEQNVKRIEKAEG